jgi:hypothetical protein
MAAVFTGSLPMEISLMTNIKYLELGYIALTGTSHSYETTEIGELTNLSFLSVCNSNVIGTLPSNI